MFNLKNKQSLHRYLRNISLSKVHNQIMLLGKYWLKQIFQNFHNKICITSSAISGWKSLYFVSTGITEILELSFEPNSAISVYFFYRWSTSKHTHCVSSPSCIQSVLKLFNDEREIGGTFTNTVIQGKNFFKGTL